MKPLVLLRTPIQLPQLIRSLPISVSPDTHLIAEAQEYYAQHPQLDQHEIAYREYQHERWAETPEAWSPLISLKQLAERPDLEVEWYAPRWIPVGAKTIICADPKCGKTILNFQILKQVLEGGKFAGEQCTPAKVLYLTEQTEHEFKRQIREVPGLLGNPNFYVLLAEETPSDIRTWEDMLRFCEKKIEIIGAKILVIDTFLGIAKLPPEGENDSAIIQNTINATNFLFKNRYLSVVMTHHNRKKTEEEHRRAARNEPPTLYQVRGSSAFVGGCGHVVMMSNPDPNGKGTDRDFQFYGRYMNGDTMKMALFDDGYHLKSYQKNL